MTRAFIGVPRFLRRFRQFQTMQVQRSNSPVQLSDIQMCIGDETPQTGFDRHYLFHIAWAARKLKHLQPSRHVDISSSLYLNVVLSAFIPVEFYDFRPPNIRFSGLECRAGDLTRLPFDDSSVPSLSCLHVLEHVGLGRYGDPLDPAGDAKGALELERVLAPGGNLLIVVPVGKPVIRFNAHRIYSHEQILKLFPALQLVEASLITDDPNDPVIHGHMSPGAWLAQEFGCGCFHFRKD